MLTQLEEAIRETEEAALDAADTDSIMTGTSFTGNQDGKRYGHWLRWSNKFNIYVLLDPISFLVKWMLHIRQTNGHRSPIFTIIVLSLYGQYQYF